MKLLPALAAAATAAQVGAAMVATRFVIDQTGPASLAMLRYAIGALCLLPAVLAAGGMRFRARDLAPIALLGIGQFGVLVALLNWGLKTAPAGRAALLFAIFPLLTLMLGAATGRERMTLAKTAGVLLSILGVGFALGDKVLAPGGAETWLGELAVLASALVGAVCSVLYRPYLQRYSALSVSAFAMLASVAALAALAAPEGFFAALPPRFTPLGWTAVLFIGIGSAAAYWLWLWALRRASPTEVSIFLALSPVTAALLGAWLLGEGLSGLILLAVACVAAGLWLAHRGG